jgi:hypothetical protein
MLIVGYAIDINKGTPMDRLLWLDDEIKRRCELVRDMKDSKVKLELYQQCKISELRAMLPRENKRGSAQAVAHGLSQMYCIVFDRPRPERTGAYVIRKRYMRTYWSGYESSDYEDEEHTYRQPIMTKNFKRLQHENAQVMIGRAQPIFKLLENTYSS